jgi:hypothetical protein
MNLIMKKKVLLAAFAIMIAALIFAFSKPQSAITGSVLPGDGAESIWAYGGTDSTRAILLANGSFSLTVRAGIYKLVVDAKPPFKDVVLENVDVKDGRPLDVGQIVLQK